MANYVIDHQVGFEGLLKAVIVRAANDLRLKNLGAIDQLTAVAYFLPGGGASKALDVLGFEKADVLSKVVRYAEQHRTYQVD